MRQLGDPDPVTERDPTGESIRTNQRGLGFNATGRPVHVKVLSVGAATIDNSGALTAATLSDCRWDSLSVMGQIGVQALGRPILSTPVLPLPDPLVPAQG